MKNEEIQRLLDQYSKGNISDEEMLLLRQATHMDAVMESSTVQAAGMRSRRRRVASFVVAGVVLFGGVGMWLRPQVNMTDQPILAQVVEEEVVSSELNTETVESVIVEPQATRLAQAKTTTTVPVQEPISSVESKSQVFVEPVVETKVEPVMGEMQILCNNECNADSVLNDVLKFLQA